MKILILRSVDFYDDDRPTVVDTLVQGYREVGDEIAVYQMPAGNYIEHWAGYAIFDYSRLCDIMICFDFPTALIRHHKKRIILTKPEPHDEAFFKPMTQAYLEAYDVYCYHIIHSDHPSFPDSIHDYINMRS